MHIHFIAIGGSAMHNLAIALHHKGYQVTGSDDEINEPSLSRLKKLNLLPPQMGWFPEKLHANIEAVILGMHARADNPELLKAKELGLKIYSYPEYLYEQSKQKKRVVIGGSHGKTTITAMIMHVLQKLEKNFDYMVGSQIEGFDTMVRLSHDAPFIILEGDEYLSSPIDRRPKFHLYKADIALLSGIAWDHINVFPTFENYLEQFRIFVRNLPSGGTLVYCETDKEVIKVAALAAADVKLFPYGIPAYRIENGITYLLHKDGTSTAIEIFGEHNLMNLQGAMYICHALGIDEKEFFAAVSSFKGAAKRLELVLRRGSAAVYKDFAHSPSKLKATTDAVKLQYPASRLIACMELHTFSSLNENFLAQYKGSMEKADEAIVYFNPHTIEHKKLKPITANQVKDAFGSDNVTVVTDAAAMKKLLLAKKYRQSVLLMMSSGNFDGIDFMKLAEEIDVN
jgi:UDP-N-acetylmuramate: L-alanyl-gamma-D-glutamyl-meso-diaminopimelate ligase